MALTEFLKNQALSYFIIWVQVLYRLVNHVERTFNILFYVHILFTYFEVVLTFEDERVQNPLLCPSVRPPARLPVCLSVCHTGGQR